VAAGTRVIAITGSAGQDDDEGHDRGVPGTPQDSREEQGNLNNHIGLPLSLMQVRTAPDVAVMELGMNHAGEISTLVAIADPTSVSGRMSATRTSASLPLPTPLPMPEAEILEGAGSATVLSATRTTRASCHVCAGLPAARSRSAFPTPPPCVP
jgi:UDP-N-acetylmuramoyl-tripeptide--D-alanyl-D-alanine ligase